jgi:glycosyltransferase involved in cell wall biosynthesis
MFEAATVGMPLVTTPRPVGANEFTNGYDAFVSDDPERMSACVLRLPKDKRLARKMGQRGRLTVARIRGTKRFLTEW